MDTDFRRFVTNEPRGVCSTLLEIAANNVIHGDTVWVVKLNGLVL